METTTVYFGLEFYRISIKDQEKIEFTSKGTIDTPPG